MEPRPPVFVITVGHSGSQSMAAMLNQHPEIDSVHERTNQGAFSYAAVTLSHAIAHGSIDESEFPGSFCDLIRGEMKDGIIWAESNWRLYNLVPILIGEFPNAKFIHLQREPRATIAARYSHGEYYNPNSLRGHHIHQTHPINGSILGAMNKPAWDAMTRFEKCCWMWKEIDSTIRMFKPDDCLDFQIETDCTPEKWEEVHRYLGVEYYPTMPIHSNQKNHDEANHHTNWTDEQNQAYERFAC